MTKTKIQISNNDLCKVCEKCEHFDDIYKCEVLREMIDQKKLEYVWCWTTKND